MNKKKVAVALSGGLDSSVTCALLQKQGYEVVGITAKMLNTDNFDIVVKNAAAVAKKLNIEHYVLDLHKEFQHDVVEYFENAYKNAITPNPCVVCNKKIKWGKIYDYAIKNLKCDYVATGHYAKIVQDAEHFKLYPASDEKKDQLYYLVALSQEQLSKTLFPLSNYKKEQIRDIAKSLDLPSKSAKESQDICFINKPMTTKKWLINKFGLKTGDFVLKSSGKKIGVHDGYYQFTIGQRKGIGIAYKEPLYVVDIDPLKNIVYLGIKSELFSNYCLLEKVNIQDVLPKNAKVMVKIRYNMDAFSAQIINERDEIKVCFDTPQSSVTKGQICAIYDYDDGHLLAGGWIK